MSEVCVTLCPLVDRWMMDMSEEFRQKVLGCPDPIIKEYRDKITGKRLGGRTFQCVMIQGSVEHINAVRPESPHIARTLTHEELQAEADFLEARTAQPTEYSATIVDLTEKLSNLNPSEGKGK